MLILNDNHPARRDIGLQANLITPADAERADIRALRLGVLNLMPVMDATEKDILRCISHSVLQIEPVWLRMATYEKTGKHTSLDHISAFYTTIEEATRHERLDGLLITGAPIEHLPFEEIAYWDELRTILDYARQHVYCTLLLCWAAMAAAYHFHNVAKIAYSNKLAGIFAMDNLLVDKNPFVRGMNPVVPICQSRHTDVDQQALQALIAAGIYEPLLQSDECPVALEGNSIGITAFSSADKRMVYNLGHFEYHERTLHEEVERDRSKTPPIHYPVEHYYADPVNYTGIPRISWQSDRTLFFANFLHVIYTHMNTAPKEHVPFG